MPITSNYTSFVETMTPKLSPSVKNAHGPQSDTEKKKGKYNTLKWILFPFQIFTHSLL